MAEIKAGRAGLGGIVAANLFTMGLALWQQWPMALLLWPFWLQSLVIGWFARKRILALREYSTEGFKVNGVQPRPDEKTKRETANFFVVHYGFFHVGYLVFLLSRGQDVSALDWLLIAGAGVAFWLGHQRSHRLNVDADTRVKRNIGALMFLPYARVVPMHLMVFLAASGGAASFLAVLAFTALKTGADAIMHVVEHGWLQKAPPAR